MTYEFRLWHLVTFLLLCELGFGLVYCAGAYIGSPKVDHLYDLDQEANIPAWFSSMQLFAVAALLSIFGPRRLPAIGVPVIVPLIAALAFLFLSMDEIAGIHERLGRELRGSAAPQVRGGRGAWVAVYVAAAVPFLLLGLRYLTRLWRAYPRLVGYGIAGCAVFVAGAVGVELFADQYLRGLPELRHLYLASVLTEEMLEMLGGTLILAGTAQLALPRAQPVLRWAPAASRLPASLA